MIRVPTNRPPTHPGEMLLEEFLRPMDISQRKLAMAIHVPYRSVNELVNRHRGITPSYRTPLGEILWGVAQFLDEPSTPVGSLSCQSGRDG